MAHPLAERLAEVGAAPRPACAKPPPEEVLDFLAAFAGATGHEVTAVIDGGLPQGAELARRYAGRITLRFSGDRRSADDLIVEMAAASRDARSLTVVTSDAGLCRRIDERRGCEFVDSETFIVRAQEAENRAARLEPIGDPREKREGVGDLSVDGWLRYFGMASDDGWLDSPETGG